MSDPTFSDIDFKNKKAWVWTTLKWPFRVGNGLTISELLKITKWWVISFPTYFILNHILGHNLGVVGITAHDNKVASVGLDCTIRLWNVQEGTEIKCIDGGPADAWSIAFSPDGNKLATGANEGKVRVSFEIPRLLIFHQNFRFLTPEIQNVPN